MIDVYSPFSLLLRVTAGDTDRADVSIAGDYEGLHLTFVGVHHLLISVSTLYIKKKNWKITKQNLSVLYLRYVYIIFANCSILISVNVN